MGERGEKEGKQVRVREWALLSERERQVEEEKGREQKRLLTHARRVSVSDNFDIRKRILDNTLGLEVLWVHTTAEWGRVLWRENIACEWKIERGREGGRGQRDRNAERRRDRNGNMEDEKKSSPVTKLDIYLTRHLVQCLQGIGNRDISR